MPSQVGRGTFRHFKVIRSFLLRLIAPREKHRGRIDLEGGSERAKSATPTPHENAATLTLLSGPLAGRFYPLDRAVTIIGRAPDCEVVLEPMSVSRKHAAVRQRTGQFVLEDLGSTHGTSLNGRRLTEPLLLRDGDTVHIGEVILTFKSRVDHRSDKEDDDDSVLDAVLVDHRSDGQEEEQESVLIEVLIDHRSDEEDDTVLVDHLSGEEERSVLAAAPVDHRSGEQQDSDLDIVLVDHRSGEQQDSDYEAALVDHRSSEDTESDLSEVLVESDLFEVLVESDLFEVLVDHQSGEEVESDLDDWLVGHESGQVVSADQHAPKSESAASPDQELGRSSSSSYGATSPTDPIREDCVRIRDLLESNHVNWDNAERHGLIDEILNSDARLRGELGAGFYRVVVLDAARGLSPEGQFDDHQFLEAVRAELALSFGLRLDGTAFHLEDIFQMLKDEQRSLFCFANFQLIPAVHFRTIRGFTQGVHRVLTLTRGRRDIGHDEGLWGQGRPSE